MNNTTANEEEIVKLLINEKIDTNLLLKLIIKASIKSEKNFNILKLLFQNKINISNSLLNDLLHDLLNTDRPNLKHIATFLIELGASINTVDSDNISILGKAVSNNDIELVQLLIEKGVDINAKPNALLMAITRNFTDIAKVLLEGGADPNVADKHNSTPLMFAISSDNFELIDALLAKPNTKINVCDNNGDTPLSLAQKSDIKDTVMKLKKNLGEKEHNKNAAITDEFDDDTLRFIEDCKAVKEAGHILGMSKFINVRKPNSDDTVGIQTDLSNSTLNSITALTKHFEQYFATLNFENPEDNEIAEYLSEMIEALTFEQSYLQFDGSANDNDIVERYLKKVFTTIHSGFQGHDITLALDDELLFV